MCYISNALCLNLFITYATYSCLICIYMHICIINVLFLYIAHSEDNFTSPNDVAAISDMFKEPMFVSIAYAKLCTRLCIILKDCDIHILQIGLITQAKAPDGVKLEKSVKDDIKSATSINELLLAFGESSCCNWLNTRLLQVLADCSLKNAAIEVLDAYKSFIFAKKLETVLPNCQHSGQKKNFVTAVCTKLNVEAAEITVGDFMNYYQATEEVVIDLGEGKLNIDYVIKGSLEINYTLPVHYSFNAYKMALHNQHKFCTIDILCVEIEQFPLIFDPWLADSERLSQVLPAMQNQYKGKFNAP